MMTSVRHIKKAFKSKPTIEGAGVHLKRAFGFSEVPLFDPFLLLDDFRSNEPQHYTKVFPWHPHRGIETITQMALCQSREPTHLLKKHLIQKYQKSHVIPMVD